MDGGYIDLKINHYWNLLGLCFLFSGPFLAGFLGDKVTPNIDVATGWYMLERFYVLSYGFIGIALALGIHTLLNRVSLLKQKIVLIAGIGLLGVMMFIKNLPAVDLHHFTLNNDLYYSILTSLPKNSILICDGDNAHLFFVL